MTGGLASLERSSYIASIKLYPQFIIFQRLGGSESAFEMKCGLTGIAFCAPWMDALARFPVAHTTFVVASTLRFLPALSFVVVLFVFLFV